MTAVNATFSNSGTAALDVAGEVHGSVLDDTITTNGAFQTIFTYDGDDVVYANTTAGSNNGGNENSAFDLGGGNDTIIVESHGIDYIDVEGGDGFDILDLRSVIPTSGVTLDLTAGTATYNNGSTNTLVSSINGIEGYLTGLKDDNITGSNGIDHIDSSAGHDSIDAGDGDDFIHGADGDDTIDGSLGDDHIFGGNDNDSLMGGDGNDTIDGENDDDTMSGGNGDDTLYGDSGNDILFGDSHNDSLFGGNDDDMLDGGAGDDSLQGGAGNDILTATLGNDIVNGDAGDDMIIINNLTYGNHSIQGGTGNDTVKFSDGGTYDVSNLDASAIEILDLTGGGTNTLISFTANEIYSIAGTDALTIEGDAGDTIATSFTAAEGWTSTSSTASYTTYQATSGGNTVTINLDNDITHAV